VGSKFNNVVLNLIKKERATAKGEDNWIQLKESMIQGAKKVVGVNKRKQTKKPWVTTEMIDKMEERRK